MLVWVPPQPARAGRDRRDSSLQLAGDLEGFLGRLCDKAAGAPVEERQRVLHLLVRDVLIGHEKITIRHRIRSGNHPPAAAATTTQPTRRVTCARVIHCVWDVVSPVLSNIYLDRLDKFIAPASAPPSQGLNLTKYY